MVQSDLIKVRYCALILGVLFLLLGLAGYASDTVSTTVGSASAYLSPGYSYVLGLFPTNYFHNAIGILVGLWGLAAFTSAGGAITFNQLFAVIYAAQAILGLLPFTNTLFGMMPLYGNNVWLSIITAAIAGYYGFVKPGALAKRTGISANA
jgi:hypothetical protein